jgi:hypothetical protein
MDREVAMVARRYLSLPDHASVLFGHAHQHAAMRHGLAERDDPVAIRRQYRLRGVDRVVFRQQRRAVALAPALPTVGIKVYEEVILTR